MDSTDFVYAGESSINHGIYLIKMDKGFIEDPFLGEREIISETIPGRETPYFYGVKTKPLEVKMQLSPLDGYWTSAKRREIARWLDQETYKEFYSMDDSSKRYFLLYKGGINLHTNGIQQGYIEVTFQNISPYTYSTEQTQTNNLSGIVSPTNITFNNAGDTTLKPELEILKYGTGAWSLTNTTTGVITSFDSLNDEETVYINNENRQIITDLPLTNRHSNFNNNYIELVRGVNNLRISGACILTFRYRFIYKG